MCTSIQEQQLEPDRQTQKPETVCEWEGLTRKKLIFIGYNSAIYKLSVKKYKEKPKSDIFKICMLK